jgi:hypothetical protein
VKQSDLENETPRGFGQRNPPEATGSDFLMDGGVTASYFFGELAPS